MYEQSVHFWESLVLKVVDLELVHYTCTSSLCFFFFFFFFFLVVNLCFWTAVKANGWVSLYANIHPGHFCAQWMTYLHFQTQFHTHSWLCTTQFGHLKWEVIGGTRIKEKLLVNHQKHGGMLVRLEERGEKVSR